MPKPGTSKQAKQIALGLYEEEETIVQAVMRKYRMGRAAAVRHLIRHGAVALDLDVKPNDL
jgi:uncharacterized protein (DUF58 family)